MGLIYLAKNKTNGHMYIGKTTYSLETRKRGHLYDATTRLRNTAFCNAIRVYGIDGFDWVVLEDNIADKDLNRKEQQYIAQYNTYLDKQHYNMTEGGEGFVPSDEIKQKKNKTHFISTLKHWASQLAPMVKNPPVNVGDARDANLIPGLRRSPGVGNDNPLQYSCLENSMDKGAMDNHGVAKSWT